MHSEKSFLPAAGHDWLLPLYDPFTKLLGIGRAHRGLIEQAGLCDGQRVLEVGCGTGNLTLLVKRLHPNVEVIGLDPDSKALARARRKAERASLRIRFDQGSADAMDYEDASFDRVFSSYMFHHLDAPTKAGMLREVRRVLKPGGRLELLDFAGHHHGGLFGWLHAHHHLDDMREAHVLSLMRDAGLSSPQRLAERGMLLGKSAYYQAAS